MKPLFLLSAGLFAIGLTSAAPAPANLDDAKVPPYTLPDPLLCVDGTKVGRAEEWRAKRRPELLDLFAREVYGRTPAGRPADLHWKVTSLDRTALGGKATRKEVTIWFSRDEDGPKMQVLIYQPNKVPVPLPVFLGLNFFGNHTVLSDPGITLSTAWMSNDAKHHNVGHHATEDSRGTDTSKWQIETVVARGYATATIYCGDLCPDQGDGLKDAVAPLFSPISGVEERAPDAWGAVGVWAWGLSRALDYIENDPDLDPKRVAVHGFSRLGKASNWAAAQDERFALLISNESGCGGAALSKRIYGETVAIINEKFPYWFARNFRRYNDNESALPIDQHELLALIAPRPLYVASAEEDRWSDPRGEFLSAKFAEPVYRVLGEHGLGVDEMPAVSHPVGEMIRYHIRPGKHDMTAYDWSCYLDFVDRHLQRRDKAAETPANRKPISILLVISLTDRVVIVTGASSGIGEATVRRLVRGGARVALSARRVERLKALCAEIDPAGAVTLAVAGDITIDADRRRLIADTQTRFGRIDALVNNAGYGQRGPIEMVAVEAIRQNFETNLFSLIALTQLVAPILRAQGQGRIVNIGSVAGKIARPLSSVYDSTKHALEAISDGLRGELAPFGVQVVVVRPGFIETEFVTAANHASAAVIAQEGPYGPYMKNLPKDAQKLHRIAGKPDDIAKKVELALTATHPKTHYAAPKHATLFLLINWLLPRGWMDRFVRMRR